MDKNQTLARKLDKMEGLTEKARDMIAATDIQNYCELFDGCDAVTLNRMAEEIGKEV